MSRMSSTDKCQKGSGSRSRSLALPTPDVILPTASNRLCRSVIAVAFVKVLDNPGDVLIIERRVIPKYNKAPSFIKTFATADVFPTNLIRSSSLSFRVVGE